MLFMLDMKVCLRRGRDRMRKLSVILVGMTASLLLAHLAWPGGVVGDPTFLLTAPPVKQRGAFWVPVEFLVRALEARYGEGRVYWNRSGGVVWLGKERYNLRLLRHHAYPDYTRLVIEALTPLNFRLQEEGKAQLSLRIEGGILSPMLSEAVRINDGVIEMVEPTQGQGGG